MTKQEWLDFLSEIYWEGYVDGSYEHYGPQLQVIEEYFKRIESKVEHFWEPNDD